MAEAAEIDFDAAQTFLNVARKAKDEGDDVQCLAACKLVAISLNLADSPRAFRLHTGHLQTQ